MGPRDEGVARSVQIQRAAAGQTRGGRRWVNERLGAMNGRVAMKKKSMGMAALAAAVMMASGGAAAGVFSEGADRAGAPARERLSDAAVNSQGINQARALERRDGVVRLVGDQEARAAKARAQAQARADEGARAPEGMMTASLGLPGGRAPEN